MPLKNLDVTIAGSLVCAAVAALSFNTEASAGDATVIALTQTPCQFLEVEPRDHGYTSSSKADCEAINDKTAEARLKQATVLKLKPGKHVFRVTNKNVSYPLGFYLRGAGLGRLTLPKVSGGGLTTGATRDYQITLEPGTYHFSCPLNSTPDYTLVVDG